MPVTLKSRLPEIEKALPLKVGEAIHRGTERIAKDAQSRADAQYHGDDNFNIEAGESEGRYGILADWYWFFGEFGTHRPQPARPFMIPAVEAGKDALVADVEATLRDL